MSLPYPAIFAVLLLVYLVYAGWVRLDPRYPVAGALALLVAAAIAQAANGTGVANLLAVYAFLLLAGGVGGLLFDHLRNSPHPVAGGAIPEAGDPPGQPPEEGDPTAEQALDHLKEHPVPPVEAAGQDDDPKEGRGDPEHEDGQ